MKVNFWMSNLKALGYTGGQMDKNMKEFGRLS